MIVALVMSWLAASFVALHTIQSRGAAVTWLGMLNFAVLQLVGIRVVRILSRVRMVGDPRRQLVLQSFGWMGPVLPFTGWWTDYFPRRPEMRMRARAA